MRGWGKGTKAPPPEPELRPVMTSGAFDLLVKCARGEPTSASAHDFQTLIDLGYVTRLGTILPRGRGFVEGVAWASTFG